MININHVATSAQVQAAFTAYLSARQAFVNELLLGISHDDGCIMLEAFVRRDVAPVLCCPLIQDASPGGALERAACMQRQQQPRQIDRVALVEQTL